MIKVGSTLCLHCHSSLDVLVVGNLDDFMCLGQQIGLDTFLETSMSIYDLT